MAHDFISAIADTELLLEELNFIEDYNANIEEN